MILYVNAKAARDGNGSKEMPFKRIGDAAQAARPGDEVVVAPGIYREYVDPQPRAARRTRASPTAARSRWAAVITGAEQVKNWKPYEGNVWVCRDRQRHLRRLQPLHHLCLRRLVLCRRQQAHRRGLSERQGAMYEAASAGGVPERRGIPLFLGSGGFPLISGMPSRTGRRDRDLYANFQGKDPESRRTWRSTCAASASCPSKTGRWLHHRQRLHHQQGRHAPGRRPPPIRTA